MGAVGCVVMAVASAWAPLQPELIDTGAACQMAPCGTLEDPERWRRSWWLWSVGALATAVAAAFVLTPRQPDSRGVLLLVMSALLVVVPLAMLAFLLSVLTSVHGVAYRRGVGSALLACGARFVGPWPTGLRPRCLSATMARHVHAHRG